MEFFGIFSELTCGRFDGSEFPGMHMSPERRAVRYEIEYYLTDAGETYCDGQTFTIRADHVQIARPGQKRHSQLPFNTMFLKFGATGEIADMLDDAPAYFKVKDADRLRALFEEIISLQEEHTAKLLLCAKAAELLHYVLLCAGSAGTFEETDAISRAKRFIEENYSRPITLRDICSAVNLSQTYFHTLFTKTCGNTPHDYLTDVRIAAAKKLLWSTDIPVTTVAEKSGFANQQYLNKVFKSKTGVTPGAYRNSFRQKYFME